MHCFVHNPPLNSSLFASATNVHKLHVYEELYGKVFTLAKLARCYNIGLNIDVEVIPSVLEIFRNA